MTQVLDKYLHDSGTVYTWIINDDGDFATVTQAELDEINYAKMFGNDPEECTCTPFVSGLCPSCLAYSAKKHGDEIPY